MPGRRTDPLTIQGIIDLHVAGHSNKEISEQKQVKLRTVQILVKRYRESGGKDLPLPSSSPGRPRKTSPRTLKVLRRQVERNPGLTARQLKEQNPELLSDVAIRTVQDTLHRDLG